MHQHHLEPKEATIRSMGEIASSLVAVVLVMCSVFIPAAFLPGTTGQLYKQFAITIVISVSVSGFIALTVTPAMCAVHAEAQPAADAGPVRVVQPAGRPRDAAVRRRGDLRHQVRGGRARPARGVPVLDLPPVQDHADELRAERGPGLRVRGDHHAAGGEPRAHAGDRRARRTRSSRACPACRRARWSPATACSTAASRPTPPRSSSRSAISTSATRTSTPRRRRTRARSCRGSSRRRERSRARS